MSPNHMFLVSINTIIHTKPLFDISIMKYSKCELSSQYLGSWIDFLPNHLFLAPFLTSFEIRIVPEITHYIKNDYAECSLLSLAKHTEA